jgi:DNA repair protein RadA/Sms
MAKTATAHRCSECGATTARWAGRCPACSAWNTLVEDVRARPGAPAGPGDPLAAPVPLGELDLAEATAVPTGIGELDRVLSGGLVPGSVTLLGGEPGIGKSTLVLQLLAARAAARQRVLLVAAEESAHQVRLRAERLGPLAPGLMVLATTDVATALDTIATTGPDLVVVDSVQAVSVDAAGAGDRRVGGPPGSIAQVRECAEQLVIAAKTHRVATVLVGHVTKDGTLAGPRALEHMVDTVLAFEGDRHHALRLLTAVKHRFGPAGELGLFEMGETGLVRVADPSRLLLGDRREGAPGSVLLPSAEGRRTLVVELQALVVGASHGKPVRSAVGIDSGRLVMVLAILSRHAGLRLAPYDVFASVVGGVRVTEPAADLALALAVASAATAVALPDDLAAVGEVGLAGEVRQVTNLPRRLEELARLGCGRAVVPFSAPKGPKGMELVRVASVPDACAVLRRAAIGRTSAPARRETLRLVPH